MKSRFFLIPLAIIGLFFSIFSCEESSTNTDLKEYGYKGAVKTLQSTTYSDLEKDGDSWLLDDAKITSTSTLTFNEKGNITKSEMTFPNRDDMETTIFLFENDRKSSYYKLGAHKDTTETGVYNWISDREYELTISVPAGQKLESFSKLDENYRDLSGGFKYRDLGDSVLFSRSYENTLNADGLITKIDFTDHKTNEKSAVLMEYMDLDAQGNPQRVIVTEEKSGGLDNLSIRKFTYFN